MTAIMFDLDGGLRNTDTSSLTPVTGQLDLTGTPERPGKWRLAGLVNGNKRVGPKYFDFKSLDKPPKNEAAKALKEMAAAELKVPVDDLVAINFSWKPTT